MSTREIVVTHILPSMSAFGATRGVLPEAVFIPSSTVRATKLEVGQIAEALLVPNTMQPERTPWFAARVKTLSEDDLINMANSGSNLESRVAALLNAGGVWTIPMIRENIKGVCSESVDAALDDLFCAGRCSKFQRWDHVNHDAPSEEWFTCYPDKADVDEWCEE